MSGTIDKKEEDFFLLLEIKRFSPLRVLIQDPQKCFLFYTLLQTKKRGREREREGKRYNKKRDLFNQRERESERELSVSLSERERKKEKIQVGLSRGLICARHHGRERLLFEA